MKSAGLFFGALLAAAAPLAAQDPAPSLRVPLVELDPPLQIDGLLDEAAWKHAVRIDGLTGVEPIDGVPAEPRTEILLMRDATHLYLGVVAWEPEPGRMVLQSMRRDAVLQDDDRIEFILDTFHDSRTAYFFQLSAAGSRGDALLANNGRNFNKRWDGFWQARTHVHADRWTAEIAIPFRSIAFGSDPAWGFNLERSRGVDRSRSRWAGAVRDRRLSTVSAAGAIEGFDDLDQGLGIEFVPYAKFKVGRTEDPQRDQMFGATGGEFNWRITPQLTGSLTYNTDFAETEADERRVNLSRFPLFFPEKRDFFLEDSNLFQFGEDRGMRGGSPTVLPYFSRRIGLAPDGSAVPLQVGARLAGRIDDLDLGLLAVSTEPSAGAGVPRSELFVARPSYRVDDQLAIGGLFTNGDPASDNSNTVAGLDARFTSTDFLPGNFSWSSWWARSADETIHDVGQAYGTQASLQTRDWRFGADALASQGAFQPALGVVRRGGERRYGGEIFWSPRPASSTVRKYTFGVQPSVWTDLSGELQSYRANVSLVAIEWHDGDRFSVNWVPAGDRLDERFRPVRGSLIPAGQYDWQTVKVEYRFSESRPVSAEVSVEGGPWYDGEILRLDGEVSWRPSAALRISAKYGEDRANLPGGDFVTRVGILNADWSLDPDLSVENLVQLDNESDILGLQSRLRWILEDGREVFVVVNSAWRELAGGAIVPRNRDFTVKAVYSLRF
ncbi:MAG TPA: DUF5916 domain-containing protein [Planctomycetota bacterium]